jgi:spoIIIJ-associated protein
MSISLSTITVSKDIITGLLSQLQVEAEVSIRASEEFVYANISTTSRGLLIGRHGETLAALQTIVSLLVGKKSGERVHVIVDVDGYRERREAALTAMAKRAAEQVMLSKKSIRFDPMLPFERRVIHLAVQSYPEVVTESQGEGYERHVVLMPAGQADAEVVSMALPQDEQE